MGLGPHKGVDEADVLAWIETGELDVRRGEDGEPCLPIREHREIRGSADALAGFEAGLTVYSGPRDRQADQVVDAGWRLLEMAQDEIAEVTTDPWPQQGAGTLPVTHAQLSQDGATVRLFYGADDNPTLELAALPIIDVLRP